MWDRNRKMCICWWSGASEKIQCQMNKITSWYNVTLPISCKRLTQVNSTHTKPSRNVIKKCTAKMMQQTMQTKQPCRQKRNNISLMKEMNFFLVIVLMENCKLWIGSWSEPGDDKVTLNQWQNKKQHHNTDSSYIQANNSLWYHVKQCAIQKNSSD